jgi:GTP cyclohydrolase II
MEEVTYSLFLTDAYNICQQLETEDDTMADWTVTRMVTARIPTEHGEFDLCLYTNNQDDKEHLALIKGDISSQSDIPVRIHSECFTGDVIGSRRCDCGEQLHRAMSIISEVGRGVIVYLRQEGRGIGLLEKLRAYNLQDEGYDTVDANLVLGHQADERDYTVAARILEDLNVQSILLLTNNPTKMQALKDLGINITARVPLQATVYADNIAYLKTKARRMHHLLDIEARSDRTPPPTLNFS